MDLILEILLFLFLLSFLSTFALDDTLTSPFPIPPLPPPPPPLRMTPLKPSIVVIIAITTTMFLVIFLMLLYAKHCKPRDGNNNLSGYSPGGVPASAAARKTSGVNRTIIESLPVFRFGSLKGEKDGLECAVCLNRFEEAEVLRLLPKCKHAFHVECVDTWLEAHSTCPLCRYRVEPEDILLCRHSAEETADVPPPPLPLRRVSGRHSSAGETAIRIANESSRERRRSCDSGNWKKERERKDGALLAGKDRSSDRRKLEHRIVIGEETDMKYRWSDVQPSDLLYLRSEMIMSDGRRFSASGSRPSKQQSGGGSNDEGSGRGVINGRSVSEITGLSRFRK